MRTYESTFIISGSVSDSEREAIIARFENLLADKGAELLKTVRWGKRQLAYEIKKQTRGYYVIFYFNADPGIIRSYHREMDINENILRYMTLQSDGTHPDYIRDEGEPSETPNDISASVTKDEDDTDDESLDSEVDDDIDEEDDTNSDVDNDIQDDDVSDEDTNEEDESDDVDKEKE